METAVYDVATALAGARVRNTSIVGIAEISDTLKAPRSTVWDAVSRLCHVGKLQRVAPGAIVPNCHPDISSFLPSSIFPWWGSKRKMAPALVALLLAEMKRQGKRCVVSPFVGSGVVEGALANMGQRVFASDLNTNIVNVHRALTSIRSRSETARKFTTEHRRLARFRLHEPRNAS